MTMQIYKTRKIEERDRGLKMYKADKTVNESLNEFRAAKVIHTCRKIEIFLYSQTVVLAQVEFGPGTFWFGLCWILSVRGILRTRACFSVTIDGANRIQVCCGFGSNWELQPIISDSCTTLLCIPGFFFEIVEKKIL